MLSAQTFFGGDPWYDAEFEDGFYEEEFPAAYQSKLFPGDQLGQYQFLPSDNDQVFILLDSHCSLGLFAGSAHDAMARLRSSRFSMSTGMISADMLVAAGFPVLWKSPGTKGDASQECWVELQPNGRLCVMGPASHNFQLHRVIWASQSQTERSFGMRRDVSVYAEVTDDGDLVVKEMFDTIESPLDVDNSDRKHDVTIWSAVKSRGILQRVQRRIQPLSTMLTNGLLTLWSKLRRMAQQLVQILRRLTKR